MANKKKTSITISEETQERLRQFGYENRISGGLSGVLEYIAWHHIKVKNTQLRGQSSLDDLKVNK